MKQGRMSVEIQDFYFHKEKDEREKVITLITLHHSFFLSLFHSKFILMVHENTILYSAFPT